MSVCVQFPGDVKWQTTEFPNREKLDGSRKQCRLLLFPESDFAGVPIVSPEDGLLEKTRKESLSRILGHGNTVFNRIQMDRFLSEWEYVGIRDNDPFPNRKTF